MKRNIVSILFFLIFMHFSSCVEDSSSGIINEINEVQIAGVDKEYRVMLYDKLVIEPEVTVLKKDAQLSYVWYLNTPTSSVKADTLCFDKKLDILLTPELATPGEKYKLTFKVTDMETGIYASKVAEFDLMTQFTKGTLILCEKDDAPVLNFLNKTNVQSYELLEECYKKANGGNSMGENATGIFALNPSDFKPQMREVLLCCNDVRGGAFLNPNTLRDHRTLDDAIQFRPEESLSVSAYIKAQMIDYLIVNGQVCKRAVNMGNMIWEAPMVSIDGQRNYDAVSPAIQIHGVSHFYDQKYGRLLAHELWNKGALKRVGNNDNDNSHFDINNIGAEMDYLCGGSGQTPESAWMILKNKTDQSLWVYKFLVESKSNVKRCISQAKIRLNSTNAPNVEKAISFSTLFKIPGILFYVTSEGIYSIDLNSLSSDQNSEIRLVNAAEKQFAFTGFEMGDYKVDRLSDGVVVSEDKLLIKAYIKDKTLQTYQGGFAEYAITQTGGLQAQYLSHRSGFCNRVIDLDEKYN